jgi:transposase InsO family protein
VEAFLASGLTQEMFGRQFGVSPHTIAEWVKRYRALGPKGLERLSDGPPRRRGREPLAPAKKQAILETKREFPTFGLRKIRDFLARFAALRVSAGSVRKTLREEGIPPIEPVRRRRRRVVGPPQRFERARPGDLWQSDITYVELPFSRRALYLVAFLDDHSRYVVSAILGTHQRQELVLEALAEASTRFGRPKEVLTDQGRQYFAWRGRSDFQKALERDGIRHLVARAHHPETVGKCERLWETLENELWSRVRTHVRDLLDARARLSHYLAHYNHFRPHQGIDGATPADRFFGVASEVRRELEGQMERNELRIALGEVPRKPLFLVGQIGDQALTLHGERGRVVVQTPDGVRREMSVDELGTRKEPKDGRDERSGGGRTAPAANRPQANEDPGAGEDAGRGSGALASGEPGGAGASAPDGRAGDPELAREDPAGGGGPRAGAEPGAVLAALAAGGGGPGGGMSSAASATAGPTADAERRRGGVGAASQDLGAREGSRGSANADRDLETDAGSPRATERRGSGGCRDGEGPPGT